MTWRLHVVPGSAWPTCLEKSRGSQIWACSSREIEPHSTSASIRLPILPTHKTGASDLGFVKKEGIAVDNFRSSKTPIRPPEVIRNGSLKNKRWKNVATTTVDMKWWRLLGTSSRLGNLGADRLCSELPAASRARVRRPASHVDSCRIPEAAVPGASRCFCGVEATGGAARHGPRRSDSSAGKLLPSSSKLSRRPIPILLESSAPDATPTRGPAYNPRTIRHPRLCLPLINNNPSHLPLRSY